MFEAKRIIWNFSQYHDKPHALGRELIEKGVFIKKNSQFSSDKIARMLLACALHNGALDEAELKHGGLDAAMHGYFMLQSINMDLDQLVDRLEHETHLLMGFK